MSDNTTSLTNLQFLEQVFSGMDLERECPVVCAFPESPEEREAAGRGWPAYHPLDSAIRRRIERQAAQNNTYFCISSVNPDLKPLNRRHDSLVATWVFPLDDIGTGAGAKYAPDTAPLPPSAVIETSQGNFQYLYFPQHPVHDTARAQALLKAMAAEHGDTGASIAAKYIRLPVGWNSKASRQQDGEPFPVRLVSMEPDLRYTVEELMQAFDVAESDLVPIRQRRSLTRLLGEVDVNDPVRDWLRESGLIQSEPDACGFVTVPCPWAEQHTGGGDTAGYSPVGEGGQYADDRQFRCLHDHCRDRGMEDYLTWVIGCGGPDISDNSSLRFLERYVYISKGDLVYDRTRPKVPSLPLQSFHNTHLNKFYFVPGEGNRKATRVQLSKEWQASPRRETVDNIGFHPGEQPIYVDRVTGERRVNTFSAISHGAETTSIRKVGTILRHLQFMFGDDYEAALDYLAATICAPERRLQYALLHISTFHGTGRGWLKQLINRLLPHTKHTTIKEISDGTYNDWMFQSTLVMVDEVYEKGGMRYALGDRMREIITENRIEVNIKYGFKGSADVYCNFLLMSNHIDAMSIPDRDRRLWCVLLEKEPFPEEYYAALYAVLEDREALNQFYWLLQRRLATGNVRFTTAPENAVKSLMQEAGRDDLSDSVRDVLNRLREAGVQVVWRGHIDAMLRSYGIDLPHDGGTAEHRHVLAVLREYGCSVIGRRMRPSAEFHQLHPGQRHIQRMVALNDVVRWHAGGTAAAKDEAERAAGIKKLVPDTTPSTKLRGV
jgi:hypothetical protein